MYVANVFTLKLGIKSVPLSDGTCNLEEANAYRVRNAR